MTKETLKTFINKYYLGGTIESVRIIVDSASKTLKVNALTDDKNVLLSVVKNNFDELDNSEIGINDTSKLLKLLNVLGDEIKGNYDIVNDKMTSITFSDDKTDIQYVTADLSVIPAAPPLKKVPPFNVEIKLTSEFVTAVLKVSDAGLATAEFVCGDFTSVYYIVETKNVD